MDNTRSVWRSAFELIVTSFIVLFQELALIRWLSGEVRVLAYFPNVVLIAAFLGLGIGTMRAGKPLRIWLWPASLTLLVGVGMILHRIAFTSRGVSEHLWLLYGDIPGAPVVDGVELPIVLAFLLSAFSFLVLGQIVGKRLQDFSDAGVPLQGYVADLTGSLIGVIAFAVASFYRTFPATWFAVILGCGVLLFLRRDKRILLLHAALGLLIVFAVQADDHSIAYSPYYAIRVARPSNGNGYAILVNGSFHQYAGAIRRSDTDGGPLDLTLQRTYPAPYRLLGRKPRHVLVLGAGNGNDVAVALDQGAERVDAVEIDPLIVELGRTLHPDHPYRSPRVRVFNTDAREFLRNSRDHYDLIVFGTLDSQTRVSALANVRLDNFVYTIDCMRMARQRLTPDGGVALYFMVGRGPIHDKLMAMLTRAFDQPPLVETGFPALFSEIFLAGPAWQHLRTPSQQNNMAQMMEAVKTIDVPTDDWPYLYLDGRHISSFYLSLALMFLIIAAALIALLAPEMRRAATQHFDAQMFLFGMAFLLLETKLVTQMNLLWGATWITSAVVFASILLMILIGTLAMQLTPMPLRYAATGLIATLGATYFVPPDWLLVQTVAGRLVLSVLFAGGPIFFASICFALLFRERKDVNLAFGWNLAGAVVGGLFELVAMTTGLRSLTLIALAAYLAAFLLHARREARVPVAAPQVS